MAQGKAYTDEQRETIIRSVQMYIKLGYSDAKACILAKVPVTTFNTWVLNDESLRIENESLRNLVSAKARTNIIRAINDQKDLSLSKWWLETKDKDEFSTSVELGMSNELQETLKRIYGSTTEVPTNSKE